MINLIVFKKISVLEFDIIFLVFRGDFIPSIIISSMEKDGFPGKLQIKPDPLVLVQIPCISDRMYLFLKDTMVQLNVILNFYFKK